MRYIWLHIKTIIDTYKGEEPLAGFLKAYCKQYPALGSRDRKLLTTMAYSWYRCAKGVTSADLETRIKDCLLLCNNELPKAMQSPGTPAVVREHVSFDINGIFPFDIALSAGMDKKAWLSSMLVQPRLFIRIIKDKGKTISLLNSQSIPFTFITDNCLSLPNGAKIDTLLPADCYVVQDASSQQTGNFFRPEKNSLWYDCCAGAGGKSLLLKDLENSVRLTVSDTRETVIYNLKKRFTQYGYHQPVAHVTDATDKTQLTKSLGTKQFDHIICDAPCSGSGTWARTPEQLYFFDPVSVSKYTSLQKQIAINVSGHLKPGGTLIYITCSVLKNENEEVVAAIIKETGLHLLESKLINGTGIQADSMYVAVLAKAAV